MNSIELRLKYVKLIQQGKKEEAFKVLQDIWKSYNKKVVIVKKSIVEEKVNIKVKKIEKEKYSNLEDLVKIKGIGKETVEDLKLIYKDLNELMRKLKSGYKLPLRNDVEKKT